MNTEQRENTDQETVVWLSSFLWHWEDSGALYDETAEAILRTLQEVDGQTQPYRYPDPKVLLQSLETP